MLNVHHLPPSSTNLPAIQSTSISHPNNNDSSDQLPILPSATRSGSASKPLQPLQPARPVYHLDSRLEKLQAAVDHDGLRIQSLRERLAIPMAHLLKPPSFIPKPRPKIPFRILYGYPLKELEPGDDPAVPKAIAPVGLNPSMEGIKAAEAHSISFLLNPEMNPSKEIIRGFTPPIFDSPSPACSSSTSPSQVHKIPLTGIDHSDGFPVQNSSFTRPPPQDEPNLLDIPRKRQADHLLPYSPTPTTDSHNPLFSQCPKYQSGYPSPIHPDPTNPPHQPLNISRRTVPIPGSDCRPRNLPASCSPDQLRCQDARKNYIANLKSNDLIGSGRISWAHARAYWDLFFRHYSNRLSWTDRDREDMDSVRSTSDLLLASILSVSSKVEGDHQISEDCIEEAKTLIRCTIFPVRDYNFQDLKGIMALAIYHGVHSVCAHCVSLCLTLNLHKVFVKLTDGNIRGIAAEEDLLEKGRTWLMVVIYSHVFCVFSNKMSLICSPQHVITNHAVVLQTSTYANRGDVLIQAHVELVTVLVTAQKDLDTRRYPGPLSERRKKYVVPKLPQLLESLQKWTERWQTQAPQLFVTDDGRPGGFAKNLRNPQQYVYLFIMHGAVWPCQDGQIIMADDSRYNWAIEGCKSAGGILSAALSAREERLNPSHKRPRPSEPASEPDLPIQIEYEKVTFGLATGYLLWICQIIPGHVHLARYRALIGRLHAIDFKSSCEYHDTIESAMRRIDHLESESQMTGSIEDSVAQNLEQLMTDTRFWFQVDIDREFI